MQDRSETITKVIEENNIPPLLKAFGKNIIPVPMKALSNVKNDFVVEIPPGFFALRRRCRLPLPDGKGIRFPFRSLRKKEYQPLQEFDQA